MRGLSLELVCETSRSSRQISMEYGVASASANQFSFVEEKRGARREAGQKKIFVGNGAPF